ncbi:MAG: RluA family pseudouridine synthase [Bdellovibrionales bacterium]
MSSQHIKFQVTKDHVGKRLDHYLAEVLPAKMGVDLSRSKIRQLIIAGGVYLNKQRVRIASKELRIGAIVETRVDLKKLQSTSPARNKIFELTEEGILYEDSEIIVVNKPSGLPTQPTLDEARDHLFASVKRFLAKRDGHESYVGLHHRLDYETSGIVLFTKKQSANKWVSDLFRDREIQKTYHALTVLGGDKTEWEVENHLARAKKGTGKVQHMIEVTSGGDYAHTLFQILTSTAKYHLVEAQPQTGRTHQIRVHLQQSGLPIVGDVLYGGPKSERVMLHAFQLEFHHPTLKQNLAIECPPPEDFQKLFEEG